MPRKLVVLASRPVTVTKTGKVKSANPRRKKKNAGPNSHRKRKKKVAAIAKRLGTSVKLAKKRKSSKTGKRGSGRKTMQNSKSKIGRANKKRKRNCKSKGKY